MSTKIMHVIIRTCKNKIVIIIAILLVLYTLTGFKRLYVNFQLSSIFKWVLTFADVALDAPSINIIIDKDGRLNLSRLAGEDKEGTSRESKGLPRVLLQNIEINQGKIDLTYHRQPIPRNVSIYPLDIKLVNISTLPDREGSFT